MNKNKNKIPKDVTALCEQVVKGYERRKKDYENKRLDIIYHSGGGLTDFVGGRAAGSISNPNACKAERLEKLEESLDYKLIRAVDESLMMLGADFSRDLRDRLRTAVMLNCENGREFPYEVLNIDEFSRRDFYRKREKFITGIAAVLGL
jgi:hypothetical protein